MTDRNHSTMLHLNTHCERRQVALWGRCAAIALLVGSGMAHAQTYMNVTVGGQFVPGVYGQVTFGNSAPPPVINVQPVLVGQPVYGAPVMYLHVPDEHSRHWARYCAQYRACGYPVHFVRVEQRNPWWDGRHEGRHEGRYDGGRDGERDGGNNGHDRGRGNGGGEGRGRGQDHRRDDR